MNKTYYQHSFETIGDLLSYLNDEDCYINKSDIISIFYNNIFHCYELFYVK